MQLFHIYHQNKFQRLIHSDFWLFEFSIWLHTFAYSMVAIFIPIFFLRIGYDIGDIMIYYLIYNAFDVPLNFFSRWLTRKIGARIVIILGSLFSVAFFVTLYNLTLDNWPLLIFSALFYALYDSFFWVAHLYLFMKCSKKDDNVSSDTSALEITRKIAGLVAPALGAFVLIFLDRKFLIVVSAIILLLSVVPLFKIKNLKDKPKRKQKSFRKFFDSWNMAKDYISAGFFSIHNAAESVIWPLFIYLFFSNIESVAVIPVIVSITTIIFMYFTGKATKKNRESLIVVGSILVATVWVLRLFLENAIFYYLSIFLVGLFSVLIGIPLSSYMYEKGEKKDTLSASTYMNAVSMVARLILYGILSVLINIFDVSFVLAAISMFIIVLVSYFLGDKFVFVEKKNLWQRIFSK